MSFLDNLTARLPLNQKPENAEYFFALNIGLSEVKAAVWTIYSQEVDILGQAALSYSTHEELLERSLQALDKALGILEIEPQKILFGVPDSWSLDDNLKEPYLKLLRRILKESELQPLAYVTTTNALAFLLQKQEGVPPTVILLGIGDNVESTLVHGGKVIENRTVKRGDHLFDDVEKSLGQFTETDVLPSKILIYSTKKGEDVGKIQDQLMSYPWMNKLPFLHFPKIENLEEETALQAIIASAAFELNPEVNFKRSFTSHPKLETPATAYPKNLMNAKETKEENLGFVRGDIKGRMKLEDQKTSGSEDLRTEEPEESNLLEPTESLEDDALMDSNLVEEEYRSRGDRYSEEEIQLPSQRRETASVLEEKFNEGGSAKSKIQSNKILGYIQPVLQPIVSFLGNFSGSFASKLIFIPVVLLAVVLAYVFLIKASVIVYVEPRILEKDTEIVADPKATAVDEAKNIIPGNVIETTVEGSGKGQATGSKQIGDPARGKVVIYNMTNGPVSLSQGTALTSTSGLKFTLDSSVKVASQSSTLGADLTTVIKPGKSDSTGISAAAIGPDSNLPASTDTSGGLTVTGYSKSSVVAMITDALSGGTSKTVTVVTSDDQKKLQAQVIDELKAKAEEQLKGKLTSDKKIISEALTVVDGKYNFNKGVNDAASEFSLQANVHFKGTSYSDSDLRTIVGKLVETNVPDGFQLNLSDTETQADVTKVEKDGKLIFKARFRAKLMPKFDTNKIKQDIRGKGIEEVAEKLKGLENVIGSEIKFTPSLPDKIARIPLLDQNINITITPK